MRKTFLLYCCAILLGTSCSSGNKSAVQSTTLNTSHIDNPPHATDKMKVKIGSSTFTVILQDNPTTVAFKSLLPMNVNKTDLNGNEKHVELPRELPTNAAKPGTIQAGDIMMYGSTTLVLFYKTFSTSYSYTRLGRIENIEGLTTAIGTGNVEVNFELE